MSTAPSPLLEIKGISKAYPGVIANDDISFDIQPGEIHALLGENGAGKSTLVKIIYGLVRPDTGSMRLNGQDFTPSNPQAARKSGVAMVFQHFSLFEALSVAENIALGMVNPPKSKRLSAAIREVSETYGLPIDPNRRIGDLSAGERQRVEIIRCLLQNPKLLIMDEPTSVLTPLEIEVLFETLNKLRSEGVAILYISHKLEEIRTLCQSATILRQGKLVGRCDPKRETARSLAEMMIGSSLAIPQKRNAKLGNPILEVRELNMASNDPFGTSLKDIEFNLHRGEILGIGGVAGNGQDELLMALSGERQPNGGIIWLKGRDVIYQNVNERREQGLLCAPEERLGHAAAPDMDLGENAYLSARTRQRLDWKGFIKFGSTSNFARAVISKFDVRTPGIQTSAKALSGGNLQKFVIGREVMQRPQVFVVNQPTWGVDAAAAAQIRQALRDLAAQDAGVLVISQDLDELMEISDSFAVIAEGRLSPVQSAQGLDIASIGQMMGGTFTQEAANVPA